MPNSSRGSKHVQGNTASTPKRAPNTCSWCAGGIAPRHDYRSCPLRLAGVTKPDALATTERGAEQLGWHRTHALNSIVGWLHERPTADRAQLLVEAGRRIRDEQEEKARERAPLPIVETVAAIQRPHTLH